MDRLYKIKDCLTSCVEGQMHNLNQADTQELGAAIDMIKDLEEAIYYHTITKAMNEPQQKGMMMGKEHHQKQQEEPMYYGGSNNNMMYRAYYGNNPSMMNPSKPQHNIHSEGRDPKEGRSPMYRMMYMNSKHSDSDTNKKMKDLEDYMHELSEDIIEMIEDASQEEKQMLRQKISLLAGKIK